MALPALTFGLSFLHLKQQEESVVSQVHQLTNHWLPAASPHPAMPRGEHAQSPGCLEVPVGSLYVKRKPGSGSRSCLPTFFQFPLGSFHQREAFLPITQIHLLCIPTGPYHLLPKDLHPPISPWIFSLSLGLKGAGNPASSGGCTDTLGTAGGARDFSGRDREPQSKQTFLERGVQCNRGMMNI